ncbi:hypothetical protein DPMN_067254 [Dreissena polymorpha]|uniref:Uncharacterized protein n=1 Tax=Dreissena polymorpha TaxID=45954 RepID=A0A9D4BVP5_DREPO|nr:hypothetical protein DPMN_067254 [Dreissena polymorpha]
MLLAVNAKGDGRNSTLCYIAICTCILICALNAHAQNTEDIKNLKTELFTSRNYNKKVRPVSDRDTPTKVSIDFALVCINNFDDASQTIKTTGFLTLKWTDELLTWKPEENAEIKSMLFTQEEVWKPDITLDNGVDSKQALGQSFIQVVLEHNGTITWNPYEVFNTGCTVNIVHFPFDTQSCDIRFVTWMSGKEEVALAVGDLGFYTSSFEKNGKWHVTGMSTYEEDADGKIVVGFKIDLKRRSSHYILFLILPAVLLSILNTFVFVLPAGSGEKVGYTLAVFLSYALFYSILSTSLPRNSDVISTVAAYLFFMMFLSTFTTVITIVELRVHNKETHGRLPLPVMKFVRLILHQRCVCCSKPDDFREDYLDGDWTSVIGPWLAYDWKDFIDALDIVLFWVFLIGTIATTVMSLVCASSHIILL